MPDADSSCRLDQWLVAARFYKTRALAAAAIKNHRISVNGGRAKPARQVSIGDIIDIEKSPYEQYQVILLEAASKRPAAKIAQTYYQETEQGRQRREQLAAQREIARSMVSFPDKRPDKHERRQLRELHRRPTGG